jgi:hypothetical protein
LAGAEGNRTRSEEIITGPELDQSGITLSENMPQRDGQTSDGDQRDGDNRQIEPAHSLCVQLRPTRLCSIADVRFSAQTNPWFSRTTSFRPEEKKSPAAKLS